MAAAYRATPNDTTHLTYVWKENRIPVEVIYGSNAKAADYATSYGQ